MGCFRSYKNIPFCDDMFSLIFRFDKWFLDGFESIHLFIIFLPN